MPSINSRSTRLTTSSSRPPFGPRIRSALATAAERGRSAANKMKVQNISIVLLMALFSCNQSPFRAADTARVIIPISSKTFGPPTPTWQPSIRQVETFEAAIMRDLREIGADHVADNLKNYRFQYLGYGDTKTKILMNAFCTDAKKEFPEWRTHWVSVSDGSSCFFGATFDTRTGKAITLTFEPVL